MSVQTEAEQAEVPGPNPGQDLLDSALSYEQQCYNKGLQEGQEAGLDQGKLEGRELGIQTGFEKFLSLGLLRGRIQCWKSEILPTERDRKILERISNLLDVYSFENDPNAVEALNLNLRKAKALAVLLQRSLGGPELDFGNPEPKSAQQDLNDM